MLTLKVHTGEKPWKCTLAKNVRKIADLADIADIADLADLDLDLIDLDLESTHWGETVKIHTGEKQ